MRIRSQFGDSQVRPIWRRYTGELRVEQIRVSTIDRLTETQDGVRARMLAAFQAKFVEQFRPQLNLMLHPAAARL